MQSFNKKFSFTRRERGRLISEERGGGNAGAVGDVKVEVAPVDVLVELHPIGAGRLRRHPVRAEEEFLAAADDVAAIFFVGTVKFCSNFT